MDSLRQSQLPQRMSTPRASAITILILAALGALVARLYAIQINSHDRFTALSRKQHLRNIPIPAKRGNIYDTRGRPLAVSKQVKSLCADPSAIEDVETAAKNIAEVLGIDPAKLMKHLCEKKEAMKRFAWVKRHLTEKEVEVVSELDSEYLWFINEDKRFYPHASTAAHVIGFVDKDGKGLEGIEASWNTVLAGKAGSRIVMIDGKRTYISGPNLTETPPVDGLNIFLTIDLEIQRIAEEEIKAAFTKHRPKSATAVVLEAGTGDILAMANFPTFDPNRPGNSPADSRRNRAVTDIFELGSVIKPFIALAALQEKLLSPTSTFSCEGSFKYHRRRLRCHKTHGAITFREGIVKSCNVYASRTGILLGKQRLYDCVTALRFGQKTGIGLPGESPGYFTPYEKWSPVYTLTSIPIGHEIQATPLQIATAFSVFANGGVFIAPRIVKRIETQDGSKSKSFPPRIGHRVYSQHVVENQMIPILEEAVEKGTGTRARCKNYRIAGKTGTTQVVDPVTGTYNRGLYVSSFACIAPLDSPRICVLVLVNEPRGEYYGGLVAAPYAGNIVRRTLQYLEVRPDKDGASPDE